MQYLPHHWWLLNLWYPGNESFSDCLLALSQNRQEIQFYFDYFWFIIFLPVLYKCFPYSKYSRPINFLPFILSNTYSLTLNLPFNNYTESPAFIPLFWHLPPLNDFSPFPYLWQSISYNSINSPEVYQYLKKAWRLWGMITRLLEKMVATVRACGIMYKAVDQ